MERNVQEDEACPCGSGRTRAQCHGKSPIDVRSPDASISYLCIFGFPEFQERLFDTFREYFLETLPSVRRLGVDIVGGVVPDAGVEAAVHALAAVALSTHLEIVLLAGNGLGFGAARGVRSLLECLFVIEDLILHSEEAERHRATGDKSRWKNLEKFKELGFDLSRFGLTELKQQDLQEGFRAAKKRFKSHERELKWRFDIIAKEIGRELEYAIYSYLSELAHPTHQAVSSRSKETPSSYVPAITIGADYEFCDFSLYMGHKSLILILEAVNRSFGLDYSERLATALSNLEHAWRRH